MVPASVILLAPLVKIRKREVRTPGGIVERVQLVFGPTATRRIFARVAHSGHTVLQKG